MFAYTASSGNASPYTGIQYAGQNGIIRRNRFYETVGPALHLTLYSGEAMYTYSNRVYNNVFSRTDFAGIRLAGSVSGTLCYDNVMKNNILTRSIFVANDTRWSWYTGELSGKPMQFMTGRTNGFLFENNVLFHQNAGQSYLITYGTRDGANPPQQSVAWWQTNSPTLFRGNLEYDPLFVDETNHNFRLKANTPLSDRGTFLTSAVGAGMGVTFRVQDASYFYDGYGIPQEQGDQIQMEGSTSWARITAIAYSNNVLTLDTPLTWSNGQRTGNGQFYEWVAQGTLVKQPRMHTLLRAMSKELQRTIPLDCPLDRIADKRAKYGLRERLSARGGSGLSNFCAFGPVATSSEPSRSGSGRLGGRLVALLAISSPTLIPSHL